MRVRSAYPIAFVIVIIVAGASWTGNNINEYIGVVLNNEIKSTAYIKSQLADSGEISGNFTKASAEDLAQILMSGPLPGTLRMIEDRDN